MLLRGLSLALARNPDSESLAEWWRLASGSGFEERPREGGARTLRFLAIDTATTCNLTCPGMCYYHSDIQTRPAAPIECFESAIGSAAADLGLRVLTFSGKEPLIDAKRTCALARYANSIPDRRFAIGLVTNATLVERHWQQLDGLVAEGGLDFIDVSLDSGDAPAHDRIRGALGTFSAARRALRRMLEAWPTIRIGVTSVLRRDNGAGILQLMADAEVGVRNFFLFPFQPPVFGREAPLEWAVIRRMAKAVNSHLAERRGPPVEITLSLLGLHIPDAIRDGLLDLSAVREDENGQLYYERRIGEHGLTLLLQVLSETGRHVLRILRDGAVLPNTHYLQSADPWQFSIGSIEDETLAALYRRASAPGGALSRLWRSRSTHACRDRPCWPVCFGGIAVADHSLVEGTPLDLQPKLCLKTASDFDKEPVLCKATG
jgi:MoaA/NifB/PqqE/SkfB family radical SAM enzyme